MADFNIRIKVDSGGAVRGARNVETQLKRTESQATKLEQTIKRTFAGLAAGQGAVQSIRFLANFAQEMSTVKAISGATGREFDELRQKAIDLGTTTRFTATQAASGMLFLARSGYETNEILEAIPGTLNLAQAGALDLGRAADIATNILKGFGLQTDQTARVVDVLALASNSANTTVEQMGQAMKFVAPIAAGVGMTLEETAAAIQVLSNSGIQASMAGTGLRRVIGALEGPTAATTKIFENLELSTEEVKVSQIGLVKALESVRSKTNDVGISLRLFGQRGGPAAEVMGKATDQMIKFAEANELAAGTGQRIADIMDDNLNGAILRVKSAFQGMLILLGDVQAVSTLRTFLEKVAEALRFLAKNARGLNDALTVLVIGFLAYRSALIKVSIAQVKWGKLMATAVGPQMIIALTAIIALIVLFKNELTLAGEGFITFGHVGAAAANQVNLAFEGLSLMMGQSADTGETGWKKAFSNILTMGLAIIHSLAQGFDRFVGFFYGVGKAIVTIGEMSFQRYGESGKKIANNIIDYIGGSINDISNMWNVLAEKVGAPLIPTIDIEVMKFDLLTEKALLTGKDVGKAFKDGLSRTYLEDSFLALLDDAEQKALNAIKLEERKGPKKPPGEPTPLPPTFGPELTTGGRSGPTFAELIAELREETELLQLNSKEYEIQHGLLDMENQLKRNLIGTERALAMSVLEELHAQQRMTMVYDDIKGPMESVMDRQVALDQLFKDGKLSVDEYSKAFDDLRMQMAQLDTSEGAGVERGLLRIKKEVQDVASTVENLGVNAFHGAEDALCSFVTTGKLEMSSLVDSILQDLTRLAIRQAILGFMPDGSGLASANGGGGMPNVQDIRGARGAQFMVGGSGGTDSQNIMLHATPGERVTVETPKQQNNAQQAPPPNINVINITDPNEIADAMGSRDGERAILNVISRNPNTVRNSLS